MGYTITVKPKTRALGNKMIAFLNKNMQSFEVLVGLCKEGAEARFYRGPLWGTSLAYCHKRSHFGFDYNAGGLEREYIYVILRWAALQVGSENKGKPAYLYDGEEWCEIEPDRYDKLGLPLKLDLYWTLFEGDKKYYPNAK